MDFVVFFSALGKYRSHNQALTNKVNKILNQVHDKSYGSVLVE